MQFLNRDDINSVAFPAISAGIYGFPSDKCADIMLKAVLNYIKNEKYPKKDEKKENRISICLFGDRMYQIFLKTFNHL